MEEWRSIPGYPSFEASDEGRIRRVTHEIVTIDQGARPKDYPRVRLNGRPVDRLSARQRDSKGRVVSGLHAHNARRVMVHVLVALAFIGECPAGYEHNHKDGNKRNARPDNLEFVTRSDNERHKYQVLGLISNKGSKHPLAKLNETEVIEIRSRRAYGAPLDELAHTFHVSVSSISKICVGKTWRHILPPPEI